MGNQLLNNENSGNFEIKTYKKSELAKIYRLSTKVFMENVNKRCQEELKNAQYRKTQRYFLPIHVEIIVKHLGKP